jgi:hypothetical protein
VTGARSALLFGGTLREERGACHTSGSSIVSSITPPGTTAIPNGGEGIRSRDKINEACRDLADRKTNGLIDRILDEDQLDPARALLLLITIYFDGAWSTQFDPEDTAPRSFTRADGSSVTVDMLNMTISELPFGCPQGLVAAVLPYGGGAFSMVVAVPARARPCRSAAVSEMETGRTRNRPQHGRRAFSGDERKKRAATGARYPAARHGDR